MPKGEKRVNSRRLTGDERRREAMKLRKMYEGEHLSIRTLAQREKRGYATVRVLLIEAGATLRSRGVHN